MIKAFILALLAALALGFAPVRAADPAYNSTTAKAERFFAHQEWASAAALYGILVHQQPANVQACGRAIVAMEMIGDSARAMQVLHAALDHGVPFESLLQSVKANSFEAGSGSLYEQFMLSAALHNPWMSRPMDAYLLKYYSFRRNGPKIVEYAQRMLAGAPTSAKFLCDLADGWMLCGEPDQAIASWKKLLIYSPDNFEAAIELANLYDLMHQPLEALPYYRLAYKVHPTPYVKGKIDHIEKELKKQ